MRTQPTVHASTARPCTRPTREVATPQALRCRAARRRRTGRDGNGRSSLRGHDCWIGTGSSSRLHSLGSSPHSASRGVREPKSGHLVCPSHPWKPLVYSLAAVRPRSRAGARSLGARLRSCSDRSSATFSRAVLQGDEEPSRSPIKLGCRGQGRRRARRAPPRLMETPPAVAVDGIVMAPLGVGADVRTGSRQRLPRPLHPREAAPRPRARTGRRHRRRQLRSLTRFPLRPRHEGPLGHERRTTTLSRWEPGSRPGPSTGATRKWAEHAESVNDTQPIRAAKGVRCT